MDDGKEQKEKREGGKWPWKMDGQNEENKERREVKKEGKMEEGKKDKMVGRRK